MEKILVARQWIIITFVRRPVLTCTRCTSNRDCVSFWSASRIRSVSLWMMTSNGPCSSRGWLRSSWRQRWRKQLNLIWTSSAKISGFHIMLRAACCVLCADPLTFTSLQVKLIFYNDIHMALYMSYTAYAALSGLMSLIKKIIYQQRPSILVSQF